LSCSRREHRLLFVNQYYWPDHASTAQHLTDLAESLAEQGYEVHVLCAQGAYRGSDAADRLPAFEVRAGVRIHRVPATSLGRRNTLCRMADYLSFYAQAAVKALRLPRFDVVVTLTTPPIIGLVGTILRRWKGTRHVYWSMDLHPDASLALGRMSRRSPTVAALAWLSDCVYRGADKVVVLGAYMADRIAAKRVRPERIVTIPVWSKSDEIYPLPRWGHPLREAMGLSGKFVAMYSGNLGLAHRFDEIVAAARGLRDRPDIVFLIVGHGPRLAEVRAAQQAEDLPNVRFLDMFPRDHLHLSLTVADVHLITLRPEMSGIVVPGKLYGAMASGRPTLFLGPDHCESADTVRQAECGLTLRPGDAAGLVEALGRLADDPERVAQMGRRGRAAFLAQHEKALCCARWNAAVADLLADRSPSPAMIPHPIPARPREGHVMPLRRSMVPVPSLLLLIAAALALPGRARGQGPQPAVAAAPAPAPAPASVAELQTAHDRALLRDLAAYIAAKPKAPDLDQAYLALFDKAIEHDWFLEHEETARRYLATFPDGPVRALAQIVATMARAQAGQFGEALQQYQKLMSGLGKSEQEEFAAQFTDSLAQAASTAGAYDIARQVYETLLERYSESPTLRQKVRDELNRLAKVGKPAPRLVVRDVEGTTLRIDDLRGRYVLIDFWATWCGPCVAELPRVQAAYAKYHDAGFDVVGVSLDETKAAVQDFVRTRKLPWRQVHNASCGSDFVEAFGVGAIPATFLLDPQGTIIRLELRGPALDRVLAQLLKDPGAVPRIGARP
jgi:glycosyltransferase involved in cell wall biosynthesis/peroxiredoxin